MLAHLGARRVEAVSSAQWPVAELDAVNGRSMPEEVDTLASLGEDGTVAVLVWRHTDDQYRVSDTETPVDVSVRGLTGSRYTVRHYRVDASHSNAHTVWKALGSPQDPTDEQLAAIKQRQGLEELEPAFDISVSGDWSSQLHLPLPSLSLLVLEPS
jgi:xylan 1,4-beta-xylosidase